MSPSDVRELLYRMDQQDEHLREIKEQVKATNGRVKSLELWQARLDGAKWAVSWVPTLATGVIVGLVVTVVSLLLTNTA